jgi:hypothetical protein
MVTIKIENAKRIIRVFRFLIYLQKELSQRPRSSVERASVAAALRCNREALYEASVPWRRAL